MGNNTQHIGCGVVPCGVCPVEGAKSGENGAEGWGEKGAVTESGVSVCM